MVGVISLSQFLQDSEQSTRTSTQGQSRTAPLPFHKLYTVRIDYSLIDIVPRRTYG
jgi:hypothetical protein